MAKLKTPEQKEKERDKRLQKTYGITADDYQRMLEEQDYGCAICKGDGGERRLHVDHDHKYRYIKVISVKMAGMWHANAQYRGWSWVSLETTKSKAIQGVRQKLKVASIRGLTCWPCNRTLRSGNNKPKVFRKMADYLDKFNNGGE